MTTPMPELLAAGFVPDDARALLLQNYLIHDYCLAADRTALLGKVADRISCMVGTSHAEMPAALINALPNLRQVSIYGAGHEKIDVAALHARNIVLTNTPFVMCDDVADLGMTLVLATVRRVVAADRFVRAGLCAGPGMPFSHSVRGKTLGIAGLGRIGLGIALRALMFGMKIAYHNRSERSDVDYPYYDSLLELAKASDVLLLAAPGGAATRHMVNAEIIAALGPQGPLINIGRGSLVDEAAMVSALLDGSLGAAGLDVFNDLAHPPEALFKLDNVVLSQHRGSATYESRGAMRDLFVANVNGFFAGTGPVTPVTLATP